MKNFSSYLLATLFGITLLNNVSEGKKDLGSEYGLRSFLMQYIDDFKVCSLPGAKEFIISEDMTGLPWWEEHCSIKTAKEEPSVATRVSMSAASFGEAPPRSLKPAKNEVVSPFLFKPLMESKPTKSPKVSKGQQEKLDRLLKASRCRPLKTMVHIEPDAHSHRYFPCQVSVKRCGGCCNSPPMDCLPTNIKPRKFPIMVLDVNPSIQNKYQLPENEEFVKIVEVEEHTKCSCQCKVQQSDCTSRQKYDNKTCQCICPKGKKKCSSKKIWSQDLCTCVCRTNKQCSTGMSFNPGKCRCIVVEELTIDYKSL